MKQKLLEIKNLQASIEKKEILKKLNLTIYENEIHVIMGPNGSGKSTLSKVLVGHPSYEVKQMDQTFEIKNEIEETGIKFCGEDLLGMSPEIRSHKGLFLAFQYPIEIAGVSNYDFLQIAYNEKQKFLKKAEMNPLEFMGLIQKNIDKLKIKPEFLERNLNEGFSGGEKKRNEILQMLLLSPKLILLDEIDSGLDIDAIRIICDGIMENKEPNSSLLIITHYPKILEYLKPNYIHIMMDGKIIRTGDMSLMALLEKEGYNAFSNS